MMEDEPDPWVVVQGIDEWAFIPGDSNPEPGTGLVWDRSRRLWVERDVEVEEFGRSVPRGEGPDPIFERKFQLPENRYVVGDPTAASYLDTARTFIEARGKEHGDKLPNHQNIAKEWTHYLALYKGVDVVLTPADVAMMMARLKDARTLTGAYNEDDDVDSIAYRAIAAEFRK